LNERTFVDLKSKSETMFIIGIPTINQAELLKNAIAYYKGHDKKQGTMGDVLIYICDNGMQGLKEYYSDKLDVIVFEQPQNLGVSGSWNFLCNEIYKAEHYALILNDDLTIAQSFEEICALIHFAFKLANNDIIISSQKMQIESGADFIMSERLGFGAFILPQSTFERVGPFDIEFFPAYFEDNDYYRRISLMNGQIHRSAEITALRYENSASIKKDPSLNVNFEENKERYIRKWGGLPHQETFTAAFGEKP
jgi:GT2 family glycosyltransferase